MNELSYRALVWLTYRLGATVALGLPLVLLVWATWSREPVSYTHLTLPTTD